MSSILKKNWISPFVAFTYIVVAVTGLLMMFHYKNGVVYNLHQWLGIICLAATIVHLANNWRVFASYFQNRKYLAPVIAAVIFALIFGAVGLKSTHENRGPGRNRHSSVIQNTAESRHGSMDHLVGDALKGQPLWRMTSVKKKTGRSPVGFTAGYRVADMEDNCLRLLLLSNEVLSKMICV